MRLISKLARRLVIFTSCRLALVNQLVVVFVYVYEEGFLRLHDPLREKNVIVLTEKKCISAADVAYTQSTSCKVCQCTIKDTRVDSN